MSLTITESFLLVIMFCSILSTLLFMILVFVIFEGIRNI